MFNNKTIQLALRQKSLAAALIEQFKAAPEIEICGMENTPGTVITDNQDDATALLIKYPATNILYCAATGEMPPHGIKACFVKPFRLGSLIYYLHKLTQDGHYQPAQPVYIGAWQLKTVERLLIPSGQGQESIRLTDKETAVLLHLHQAKGEIVTREELLAKVWSYSESVTTHTLETHIWRLRQKIEEDPANARLLITEEGGYRLKTSAQMT